MSEPAYAWAGDVATFVASSEESLLESLTRSTRETGAPQLFAWHSSIGVFKEQLSACLPDCSGIGLVLEYELPRSGGRRPDLILLENGTVILVEFKNRVAVERADIDQVRRYVRDLEDYHAGCHGRRVVPILIPMGMSGSPIEMDGVSVMPPSQLGAHVRALAKYPRPRPADVDAWTSAPYEPLPGLIEAARLLFERQPLPRIRRAESARVPETVALIESVVAETQSSSSRALVLVTGVPGAGKTLVGLQLAHSRNLSLPAVFVSGNGPLVQVLQYELGGGKARREFVQDLRSYLLDNVVRSKTPGKERVIIFDEAQRAWDQRRVLAKSRGTMAASQPQLLVNLANRVPHDPFVVVGLIGEGQEINAGEESGLQLWVEAVSGAPNWTVVAPEHLAIEFRAKGVPTRSEARLALTASLRSHRASESSRWANLLLEGQLEEAGRVAIGLRHGGYDLRISRDLEPLRQRVRDLYTEDLGRRYGLVVSSKFRRVDAHGVSPLPSNYWYHGEWYGADRSDRRSGAQLDSAETEFGCQGLELDLPILCWGPDLTWSDTRWNAATGRMNREVLDPDRLRINAYRVLLTRGRDGLFIFLPREPVPAMDDTYRALIDAGVRPLES